MMTYADKLTVVRSSLKQQNLDAYLITVADPHLDEEIPDHWKIIHWLTGFTGSAATVVITDSFAGLWTDSRYVIQAHEELPGTGFELAGPELLKADGFAEWLINNLAPGSRIGLDGRIWSIQQLRRLNKEFARKGFIIEVNEDLISGFWNDRPSLSENHAFDHSPEFAGKERSVKISEVRQEMNLIQADCHLLTSPDDIMWLLNLRGRDLRYSPILLSYAIISAGQIILFTDESKIPDKLKMTFDSLNIVILPYTELDGMLSALESGLTLLLSPEKTSVSIFNSIPAGLKIIEDISIPARLKSVKNKTEIENIGKTMVRDGVALTRFFYFIEENTGFVPMTELSLSVKLHECRSEVQDFISPSFESIVAFNEHAALPHYTPSTKTDSVLGENGILLVDSGGQYPGGTTDITRTISIGPPSTQEKSDFTLVLKGHINLATAKFPLSTKGYQLDILARKALWENGLNYGHGTGHGVGYFLNVHEGPPGISPADNRTSIEPGMLVSNEPSVYRQGEYGIRLENLMICYEDEETLYGHFLKFDTVSLCYIDKKLIDKSLLGKEEIEWLNSYHAEVYTRLGPFLSNDEKAWLKYKTDPL